MKRMASVRRKSSESDTSTRSREARTSVGFVVCVRNEGYEASLERNKIYLQLKDEEGAADRDIRVVDESGEDYLYSKDRFVPVVDLPAVVKTSVRKSPSAA